MRKFHLIFIGIFIFFSTVFTAMIKAENKLDIEDEKSSVVNDFNQDFEVGEAIYYQDVVTVNVDLEKMANSLGWTVYHYHEYSITFDGRNSFVLFCDFIKEVNQERFLASGFKNIEMKLIYKEEVIQYFQEELE
ncbi:MULTISPECIES: hypothetical protein [Flammeovirga]|uniref:Uncharacterized protein n=1 Tax=Flammeovirga agarivorans TaxID=2726742 RepID=A0A7X8SGF4_9BACT|nr:MULTISPECIES: hypothetical protein [Flammeovirga]NLR89751.1 hypothetical protein [Flammeovirga agarivorans]